VLPSDELTNCAFCCIPVAAALDAILQGGSVKKAYVGEVTATMTQGVSLDKLEEGYAAPVSLKRMWEGTKQPMWKENSRDTIIERERELQNGSRELRARLVGVAGGRRLCKTQEGRSRTN
jgi:hypothetical protein